MSPLSPVRSLHRFPFVMLDGGEETGPGSSIAHRLVSVDDALFEGRAGTTFAQSLLVEAMAQAALFFADREANRNAGMLVGLSRVRFGRAPRPGERLVVEARLMQRFGDLIRIGGRVSAGEEILSEGEILISLAVGAEKESGRDG